MKCKTEHCDQEINPRSLLAYCSLCRASMHRWLKRKPVEVVARKNALARFADRMRNLRGVRDPK